MITSLFICSKNERSTSKMCMIKCVYRSACYNWAISDNIKLFCPQAKKVLALVLLTQGTLFSNKNIKRTMTRRLKKQVKEGNVQRTEGKIWNEARSRFSEQNFHSPSFSIVINTPNFLLTQYKWLLWVKGKGFIAYIFINLCNR